MAPPTRPTVFSAALVTCQTVAVRTQILDPDLDQIQDLGLDGSSRILRLCFLRFPCQLSKDTTLFTLLLITSSRFVSRQTLVLTFCPSLLLLAAAGNFAKVGNLFVCHRRALNLRGNFSAFNLFEEENIFLSPLHLAQAFIFSAESRQATSCCVCCKNIGCSWRLFDLWLRYQI